MYEMQLIDINPNKIENDKNKPHIKKYPALEFLYNKYIQQIKVFTKED
jgi:hypothetical protein